MFLFGALLCGIVWTERMWVVDDDCLDFGGSNCEGESNYSSATFMKNGPRQK